MKLAMACLALMANLIIISTPVADAVRMPGTDGAKHLKPLNHRWSVASVGESCRALIVGQGEHTERVIAWLNVQALKGSPLAVSGQDSHDAGVDDHAKTTRHEEAAEAAAALAKEHEISVADAIALCAAVGLEQLSQVNILSYGQGLRVGRLDVPAAAQAPATQGCPVEQFKALMHKLNLLDDKGNLQPEAYLAALEAAGTFPEGQPPAFLPLASDAVPSQASRRLAGYTPIAYLNFWQNLFFNRKPPPAANNYYKPPPPANNYYKPPPPANNYYKPPPPANVYNKPPPVVVPAYKPPSPPPPPPPSPPPPASTPDPGDIPDSPYSNPADVCVTTVGQSVIVGIHPATPFPVTPFTQPFKDPVKGQKYTTTCSSTNGHCMDAYMINIYEAEVDLGLGCPANVLTKVLTYNGSLPGPTIETPVGKQTLIRFNNMIDPASTRFPSVDPCNANGLGGRPTSVHVHGMASLAPYDGFAIDRLCYGQSKDYIYPNDKAASLWYHDHALDITSENAYGGLAGMYVVKKSSALGTEPDRWGLDGMEEKLWVLQDKTLDSNCQLLMDTQGFAREDFWGDINLVSGVPWPVLDLQPKWYRIRILSGAVSRAWLLSLRDANGVVYSGNMCQVIAGDGGYRRRPIPFPAAGLYMGVGERYEIVCDFSQVKGKTLFLWNEQDISRMADAPFFCYSHLLMKINVGLDCMNDKGCNKAARFQPPGLGVSLQTSFDKLFSVSEYNVAKAFAEGGGCHRNFIFNQTNGQWTINGETWHTARVAASDVGSNAWEVWCIEGATGDHPVHFHLIDFYILKRFPQGDYQVQEPFETEVPKDVMVIHPGAKVAGLARWGPHRGEYLFHCHNLRHEDTAMMRTFITNNPINANSVNAVNQSFLTRTLSQMTFTSLLGKLYDTYADPVVPGVPPISTNQMPPLTAYYLKQRIDQEIYRIFYPGAIKDQLDQLCNPIVNPWLVKPCAKSYGSFFYGRR